LVVRKPDAGEHQTEDDSFQNAQYRINTGSIQDYVLFTQIVTLGCLPTS
jgi:hypothetical protein